MLACRPPAGAAAAQYSEMQQALHEQSSMSGPGTVEIIPLRLPEMETPRPLDDWSAGPSAGPSWRDPRLNDQGRLPNRLLPPEHFAYGSRKGRAEFERRQLIATGRVSSLHGAHEKAIPPQNSAFASRQTGYQAAIAKREAFREEADELSQLFDAQVSERTFNAAFAPLKAAKVEEQACAAIEGIEAVLRVPPHLQLLRDARGDDLLRAAVCSLRSGPDSRALPMADSKIRPYLLHTHMKSQL